MEVGKYFVFGKKEKVSSDQEIIFIGKGGDFPSLEKYLETVEKHDIYNFTKNHFNIQYFSDSDTFISSRHKISLELRLQEPYIPRKSLVITEKGKKIQEIIDNKYDYTNEDYDIFSGEPIGKLSKDFKIKILSGIVLLSKVMYQMLEAGFLDMKTDKKIDDWIVLFQEPILDIFIRYHQIPTSAVDIPTSDEFIINPMYRKMILETMMKIMANFVYNNKYVKLSEVSKFESWENPDLWFYMKENVKIFKV